LIEIVERLAVDFSTVAPELIASPKHSLFRIYRDTRFSSNKQPLKTHAAAVFRTKDLPRPQGAGLYFEIAPHGSGSAAGCGGRSHPSSCACARTSPRRGPKSATSRAPQRSAGGSTGCRATR